MNAVLHPTHQDDAPIELPGVTLRGDLHIPAQARAVVLFAHGSGSSRKSFRNRFVARLLQETGFGTLLFDLLTADEERVDARTGHLRFDIPLLAGRLQAATEWMDSRHPGISVGYFGASTGAAAALIAAARLESRIAAVVSRGGRPDLAGPALPRVTAPTLLIVGGEDHPVLDLNRRALAALRCEKRLEIVAGAAHLFEEPGALEKAAHLAAGWFGRFTIPRR